MMNERKSGKSILTPHMKIHLSTGTHGGVGEGRFGLLAAIEQEGSLKAAAAKLNISYRKAWGDLNVAEKALGVKLIEKDRGGATHGGTSLTEEGKNLLRAYTRLQRKMEQVLLQEFTHHFERWIQK